MKTNLGVQNATYTMEKIWNLTLQPYILMQIMHKNKSMGEV